MKACFLILVFLLHSFAILAYEIECSQAAEEIVLFADLNASPGEVETAKKIACQKGKGFVVLPENSREAGAFHDTIRRLNDLYKENSCHNTSSFDCKDIITRRDNASKSFYDKIKELDDLTVDLIGETIQGLEEGGRFVGEFIVSGHSGGGYFDGELGAFEKKYLAHYLKDTKTKERLDALYLLGCYTNVVTEINEWTEMFPGTKFMAGFGQSAPLGHRKVGHNFLEDLMIQKNNLLNLRELEDIRFHIEAHIRQVRILTTAIYMTPYQGVQNAYYVRNNRGSNPTIRTVDQNECHDPQKIASLENFIDGYESYFNGLREITNNFYSSDLRKMYDYVRVEEHCFEDASSQLNKKFPTPMQVFKLVFFNRVKVNFFKYYQNAVETFLEKLDQIDNPSLGLSISIENFQRNQAANILREKSEMSRTEIMQLAPIMRDLAKYSEEIGDDFAKVYDQKLVNLTCVPFSWHDELIEVEAPHCYED